MLIYTKRNEKMTIKILIDYRKIYNHEWTSINQSMIIKNKTKRRKKRKEEQ